MNEPGVPDPLYISARRVLLDALEALESHIAALVLVGAQAVYLRVGESPGAISPFTSDADIAVQPNLLSAEPALEDALQEAGFSRRSQPGLWFSPSGVEVDLLVPESIAGPGNRAANLGENHDRMAAMRAAGLEAALVDNAPMVLEALEAGDSRKIVIAVAGPAALLVAKLHKIGERAATTPTRLKNKDASDLYLILVATPTHDLAKSLRNLLLDETAEPTVVTALGYLRIHFASREGHGLELLSDAYSGLAEQETVVASCEALAQELLSALE